MKTNRNLAVSFLTLLLVGALAISISANPSTSIAPSAVTPVAESTETVSQTTVPRWFPVASSPSLDAWEFLLNPDRDYLHTIVNATHPYEFGSAYDQALQSDLVYVMDDVYGDTLTDQDETPPTTLEGLKNNTVRTEKAAYLAYTKLKSDLKKFDGIDIGLLGSTAGYRTAEDQQWIYDNYGGGIEPGYSEHHTGLVLSVVFLAPDGSGAETWQVVSTDFAAKHPEIIEPFLERLGSAGFILRYPEGKEEFTGIPAIYRDIRFIGDSDIARFIYANNLCLEEYLEAFPD